MSTARLHWISEATQIPARRQGLLRVCDPDPRPIREEGRSPVAAKGIETFLLPFIKAGRPLERPAPGHRAATVPGLRLRVHSGCARPSPEGATNGWLTGFVTMNGTPIPVPEKQIEGVQLLLSNNLACRTYAFINEFESAGAASTGGRDAGF
jgi:hypothetical protein